MTNFLNRNRVILLASFMGLVVYFITLKPVFLHMEGEYVRFFTHASSEAVAFRDAGITFPDQNQPTNLLLGGLQWGAILEVPTGRWVEFVYHGNTRQVPVSSSELVSAAELLRDAGIELTEDDSVFADGLPLPALDAEITTPLRLEVRESIPVHIQADGKDGEYQVAGPTVGDAVWQAGIRLRLADEVVPPPETVLPASSAAPMEIQVVRARSVRIQADGEETATYAAGKTVGEALAQSGFALTDMDFSIPKESDPVPADGRIRVVRVQEEVLREQESIPFETETRQVAELELDQQKLIQAGIPGIQEKLIRIRYEDGVETARTPEGTLVVLPPQSRILGYGTKIVIRTLDTPNGPVEYWRKVTVYATSYSPCRLGVPDRCGYVTFSGKRVDRGMIAMVKSWYYLFQGQSVYVPGYGSATVEDVGYPTGTTYAPFWIDLFYLDDETDKYKPWHQWTTLYFLKPVPANVPYLLQ